MREVRKKNVAVKNKTQKEREKFSVVRSLTKALELPGEITLNLPLISMVGNEELIIENYKSVIEYSDERIRIKTATRVVRIEGRALTLAHITSENIAITGNITKMEFLT